MIKNVLTFIMLLSLSSFVFSDDVLTEFNSGDILTADKLNELKNAINSKQDKITSNCSDGQLISNIGVDGVVSCESLELGSEIDADTIDGIDSSELTKSNQTCTQGFVSGIDGDGRIVCSTPTSSNITAQSCSSGYMTGIDENGKIICSSSEFIMSGQQCDSGSISGVDAVGNIICAAEVYFSVKYNLGVDLSDGTIQILAFDSNTTTVISNVGAAFNEETGVFRAPESGTYTFSGSVDFRNISVGDLIYIEIHAGGMNYNGGFVYASGRTQGVSKSVTVHLNAGESAYLKAYANSSSDNPVANGNDAPFAWTYFTGARVQ